MTQTESRSKELQAGPAGIWDQIPLDSFRRHPKEATSQPTTPFDPATQRIVVTVVHGTLKTRLVVFVIRERNQ